MDAIERIVLDNEITIRAVIFIGIFAAMAAWEVMSPRRAWDASRKVRWPANFGIVVIDSIVVRLLFPMAAVGVALWADANSLGLFPFLDIPQPIAVLASIIILDGIIYWQHVIFHKIPVLWRLHRMHHADTGFDVSTALRFHPIEIIISMVIKIAAVIALGAPVLAVIIFEILLNGSAMFNHGNVKLPKGLDRALRLLIVTPDMHRVHHSADQRETNSNYGFCLSIWDRVFGSYVDAPRLGQEKFVIGLEYFRDPHELRLDKLLLQPFRSDQLAGSRRKTAPGSSSVSK